MSKKVKAPKAAKRADKPVKAQSKEQTIEEAAKEKGVALHRVGKDEARDNIASDTPSEPDPTDGRHQAHDPAEAKTPEQIEAEKPKPTEPNEAVKPIITYEVLGSNGTDDQFEYKRVNVKVTPPFNGFDEAVITVPCPIHNSKGPQKQGAHDQLIREKALWKVNSQMGPGAAQLTAEDVKSAEEQKEA